MSSASSRRSSFLRVRKFRSLVSAKSLSLRDRPSTQASFATKWIAVNESPEFSNYPEELSARDQGRDGSVLDQDVVAGVGEQVERARRRERGQADWTQQSPEKHCREDVRLTTSHPAGYLPGSQHPFDLLERKIEPRGQASEKRRKHLECEDKRIRVRAEEAERLTNDRAKL